MRQRSCCFTGHRAIPKADMRVLPAVLREEILRLADRGVTEFFAGGARGFDMLAAEAVLELRQTLPVHLHLILPCPEQDAKWSAPLRERYRSILNAADSVCYIADEYDKSCMRLRNDALVESAAYCICYQQRETGGTAYTVRKARRAGLEVIHLMTAEPVQMTLENMEQI